MQLNASVVALPGTVFIGKWSSYGDVEAEEALQQTGVDWFDKMFLSEWKSRAEPHPGEFLVPEHIPLSYTRRLVFYTEADWHEASSAIKRTPWPEGVPRMKFKAGIEPGLFGRKMREEEDQ